MRGLSLVAAPAAVWALHISIESVLRFMELASTREKTVTEDEVNSLIGEGTQAGIFVPQEQEMIEGVLRLVDLSVGVIMTLRTRIVWVDVKSERNTIMDMVQSHRFSRLLVCDGSVDHHVGFIYTKTLLLPEAPRLCKERTGRGLRTEQFPPTKSHNRHR